MTNITSVTRDLVVKAAVRRGWKIDYFGPRDYYYQITNTAGVSCTFHGSMPDTTSAIGAGIAVHKARSLFYLQHRGYDIAPFLEFTDHESARAFLHQHAPIVVKPNDSEQSKGVSVGITDEATLWAAIETAQLVSSKILLQKQLEGKLYRLLSIGGTFVAATWRRAAFVVGDGTQTIGQLIAEKNQHPWRGNDDNAIIKIIDPAKVTAYLGPDALERIPQKGEEVKVLLVDSVSAGGEAADVTEQVHPDYIAIVEAVAKDLGLVSCGFDIMTPDISQPLDGPLPFLEMNSEPGFKIHYYPTAGGEPRPVADLLLDATLGKET